MADGGRVIPPSLILPAVGPASLPVAPPAATLVVEQPERMPGKVSATVTPVAVLGPLFEATSVYVTVVPGTSVVAPSVLEMATSLDGTKVSVSVAELLAGVGSEVEAEEMLTVLAKLPVAAGSMLQVTE